MIDLPEELAATAGPACIIWNVNACAAFVVKLDQQTIDGFRGTLPIGSRAECGFYPDSAVVRLVCPSMTGPSLRTCLMSSST